jgi:hypothetical protein
VEPQVSSLVSSMVEWENYTQLQGRLILAV